MHACTHKHTHTHTHIATLASLNGSLPIFPPILQSYVSIHPLPLWRVSQTVHHPSPSAHHEQVTCCTYPNTSHSLCPALHYLSQALHFVFPTQPSLLHEQQYARGSLVSAERVLEHHKLHSTSNVDSLSLWSANRVNRAVVPKEARGTLQLLHRCLGCCKSVKNRVCHTCIGLSQLLILLCGGNGMHIHTEYTQHLHTVTFSHTHQAPDKPFLARDVLFKLTLQPLLL